MSKARYREKGSKPREVVTVVEWHFEVRWGHGHGGGSEGSTGCRGCEVSTVVEGKKGRFVYGMS